MKVPSWTINGKPATRSQVAGVFQFAGIDPGEAIQAAYWAIAGGSAKWTRTCARRRIACHR